MLQRVFGFSDPKDELKKVRRSNMSIQRDLDREGYRLAQQENQIKANISQAARKGEVEKCKILSKQLLRLRAQKGKNLKTSASIAGVGYQVAEAHSTMAMGKAMKETGNMLMETNKQINLPSLQKKMQDFSKASNELEITGEMLSDTLDMALENSGDEEEEEDIMNQVLEEIGIQINTSMPNVPSGSRGNTNSKKKEAQEEEEEDEDEEDRKLKERLDALNK